MNQSNSKLGAVVTTTLKLMVGGRGGDVNGPGDGGGGARRVVPGPHLKQDSRHLAPLD